MTALISDRNLAYIIVDVLREREGVATWRDLERDKTIASLSEQEYMAALNAAFDLGFVRITNSGTKLELTAKLLQVAQ